MSTGLLPHRLNVSGYWGLVSRCSILGSSRHNSPEIRSTTHKTLWETTQLHNSDSPHRNKRHRKWSVCIDCRPANENSHSKNLTGQSTRSVFRNQRYFTTSEWRLHNEDYNQTMQQLDSTLDFTNKKYSISKHFKSISQKWKNNPKPVQSRRTSPQSRGKTQNFFHIFSVSSGIFASFHRVQNVFNTSYENLSTQTWLIQYIYEAIK